MGKVQQRAGGGKVTVTGLAPAVLASGITVTVKQGNKIIREVTGTSAMVSKGESYNALAAGVLGTTSANLYYPTGKNWKYVTTSVGFDVTLWDSVTLAFTNSGGSGGGEIKAFSLAVINAAGTIVKSASAKNYTFDLSDVSGKCTFRAGVQASNSWGNDFICSVSFSTVTLAR